MRATGRRPHQLFLLSAAADYVTGATVTIDGGLSLTVAQGA